MVPERPGATIWLTGLPSAGKSTLATLLADRLRHTGRRVEILDGDEVRQALSPELGFSKADRDLHVTRIGYLAHLLARNGTIVLVPVIAPYSATRAAVRERHRQSGTAYVEVHVDTPVEVCRQRDVKGLYGKHRAGLVKQLTGVDDPYEAPVAPEVRIEAHGRSAASSAGELHHLLVNGCYI